AAGVSPRAEGRGDASRLTEMREVAREEERRRRRRRERDLGARRPLARGEHALALLLERSQDLESEAQLFRRAEHGDSLRRSFSSDNDASLEPRPRRRSFLYANGSRPRKSIHAGPREARGHAGG